MMKATRTRARRATFTLAAWLAAAALYFGTAAPSAAQTVTSGTLLVASPELGDPNFARSVILVLRHDDEGTIGVVLNRPTNLVPATIFPELGAGIGSYQGHLFRGGPIAATRLLYIVRGLAAATVSGPEVLDKVFLSIDDESLPDMVRLADGTNDLRLYAGHAAWVTRTTANRDQCRRLAIAARLAGARVPRRSRRSLGGARRPRRRTASTSSPRSATDRPTRARRA